ncbi:MAG: cell wall hydrolase [Lachnospiraceae bacterium]|nr:cell wall hydrolase [Lachnospiraceae bacterium]
MKRLNNVLIISMLVLITFFMGTIGNLKVYADENDIEASMKAQLGSLAQTEEGQELLPTLDAVLGNVADTDAVFLEAYNDTDYKDNGFTKKDVKLIAAIIYCEAGSQTFESKVAVANTILNRMRNTGVNEWGHVSTIYEVIYDNKWGVQFTPTKGNPSKMDEAMKLYSSMDENKYQDWQLRYMKACKEAALAALAGYKTIPDNFMYFNSHMVDSRIKCQDNGREFSLLDKHIYFTTDKYAAQ